jgi:mannose/fructose/N-acetylgalactosamine-specific phosphotransferase system component IID
MILFVLLVPLWLFADVSFNINITPLMGMGKLLFNIIVGPLLFVFLCFVQFFIFQWIVSLKCWKGGIDFLKPLCNEGNRTTESMH